MRTREQIDEIDQLLFDAGVLVLGSKNNKTRRSADEKITDARVRLQQLRTALRYRE